MKTVARFEKVSYEVFKDAVMKTSLCLTENEIKQAYDNIQLPTRSTKRSSGYDFKSPFRHFSVSTTSIVIPTGIRIVFTEDGYDLSLMPRSGHGFKYRAALDNTIGLIDNDYSESENTGHIMVKMHSTSYYNVELGDKFCQGVIREFFLAEEEEVTESRVGGFGSTGN